MKGKNMRHFEYKDLGTNSYKFWEISLIANKVKVKFGRIGIQNPAENEKSFTTINYITRCNSVLFNFYC